jgi:membrane fusion protein, heavy metal efflux system
MKIRLPITILIVLALGGVGAFLINRSSFSQSENSSDGHGAAIDEVVVKGPHNGRMLTDGDFTLELAIFEEDVPPEFRAWFSLGGRTLPPEEVDLTVKLIRPGSKVDTFVFAPIEDYALGDMEVGEPHSFSYEIQAKYSGRTHRWAFDAPEMQTVIDESAAEIAGMEFAAAGPATLDDSLTVYGQVKFNENKLARAEPRFGGIILKADKLLGDSVKAGEVVALVETNQTLLNMEVKAPIDGVIVERTATAGETVSDGDSLYTIADYSEVWVELNIPKRDQARVRIGQRVIIHPDDGGEAVVGEISWISPITHVESQTVAARVVLPNPEGRWRPGLFVKAEIALGENVVDVAVKESGIQSLFHFTVVFSQHGELYQARPLELGRRGGGFVEVLKGIEAGEHYVVENSFLVKADIGKSGATHDH